MESSDEIIKLLGLAILGDIPGRLESLEDSVSTIQSESTADQDYNYIDEALNLKVDKVSGKDLSSVDFTVDLHSRLVALPLETIVSPEVQPTGSANGGTALIGNGSFDSNPISGDPYHLLEVNNNNTGKQCVRINSYGADSYGNNVHFCRYFGTQTAPSAISSGAFLMSTGYRGHDGSSLSQSMAAFQVVTTENWSPTAHGIRFQWEVTPKGSSTRRHMMELDSNALYVNGSIGVGKNLAPWHQNYRVVEVGGVSGCAVRGHVTDAELTLTCNAYYDTAYRRGVAGAASAYQMTNGGHAWMAAASGTSGAAITFKSVMTLDAAGILRVGKDSATGRSINATGTVNASGADYAEYVRKSDGCGKIQAGQVVGIDCDGLLTDKWCEAISFLVKSTTPAYVGGDDFDESEADRYDRMAFAGRIPVNVVGAKVGDYIVPTSFESEISGTAITTPGFDQYRAAVGRVISVAEDGRAIVIVKAV